ncbi:MAG TPA: glycine betaine ABC transporter substrate-binding protein [Thermoanaerobaculia bacterium]|nr:glycine betaine ABC transporter substrate-binding protein [Thermoanaerobaculia bacterium]
MTMRKAVLPLLFAAIMIPIGCREKAAGPVVVGSKNFTESVILGEILAQQLERAGCRADRRLNMGGTFVADRALRSGALDAYVEYSGTALTAILDKPVMKSRDEVDRIVARAYEEAGLRWGPNLGFNNTFAMIVRKDDAARAGLASISDLQKVEERFQPGFGYEFVERPDGWKGLLATYGLQFARAPRTMDLGLTYKALAAGELDLIAGNSTDGLIESLGLTILRDDRGYFPPYDAAIVSRADLDRKCEAAPAALSALGGTIDDATMRRLNFEVDGAKRDVREVAREFLASR